MPTATIDQLEAFYREQPDAMFGTPVRRSSATRSRSPRGRATRRRYYRNGDYGIGHIAICPAFDEEAFKTFRDAYRGNGPEGIPESTQHPGLRPRLAQLRTA